MPFTKYSVEPVRLSRKPIPPDKCVDDELEAVTNNTLVQVVRQLASLVNIADHVFFEVADTFRELATRTERLKSRVETLDREVSKLNAKKTCVPQGDMKSFSLIQNHFQSSAASSWTYFIPSQRPGCVQSKCLPLGQNYSSPLLRIVEQYGAKRKHPAGSFLFCWPVIGDSKWKEHLEIETRKPAQAVLSSSDGEDTEDSASSPVIVRQWPSREEELERLPSPEERMLAIALEHPSMVVPVNTNTFHRMASLRRSLMHPDFLIKRKSRKKHGKRRNTICVESCSSQKDGQEIQTQVSKSSQTEPSTSRAATEVKSSSGIVSFLRDKAKRHSVVPTERNSLYETVEIIPSPTGLSAKEKRFSLLSLRSAESKEKRDTLQETKKTKDDKAKRGSVVLTGNGSGTTSGTKSTKSRSFLPISTLSAAMSVAVKLRGTIGRPSKGGTDDPQSSSGNWSATSSNRGSVDSDQRPPTTSTPEPGSITSQSSLEKDSMLSDTTQQEGRSHDGILTGYTSDASTSLVNSWRPVKIKNRSNTLTPENHYSDATGSSTPRVASPYACNQPFMDAVLDDEESVYSVDTDGYYTSMHTDSGLKNMSLSRSVHRRESESSVSTLGNVSLNSILSRSALESSPPPVARKKCAPTPPMRVCIPVCPAKKDNPPLASPSESDPEAKERLRMKTKIDPSRYPSMCSVSPDTSDEDRKALLKESQKSFKPANSPVSPAKDVANKMGSLLSSFAVAGKHDNDITKNEEKTCLPAERCNIASKTQIAKEKFLSSFASNTRPSFGSKSCTSVTERIVREEVKSPTPSTSSLQSVPPKMPLIPLKYAQHITVTPVIRNQRSDSEITYSKPQLIRPIIPSGQAVMRPHSALGHSSSGPRAVAKVTLDSEGKVIFSSNSLGRRRDGHPMNYLLSSEQIGIRKYSTLPTRLKETASTSNADLFAPLAGPPNLNNFHSSSSICSPRIKSPTYSIPQRISSPSVSKPAVRPNSIVPLKSNLNKVTSATSLDSLLQSKSSKSVLQPVVSSGSTEQLTSPPSLQSSKSSSSSDSLGKKMSTEDLFLAIHQCKKKLNLKGNLMDSPPSRCISPLSPPSRPQSRSELAESGRLTPRKDLQLEGLMSNTEPRRKTLVSDRLGTNRQTSMRDFKLLLLQARSAPGSTRKSASELLRVSTPTLSPGNSSSPVPRSASLPSSPCRELLSPIRNGYEDWNSSPSSTIPFKRNSRCRSSLQSRYEYPLYPPILEEGEQSASEPAKNLKTSNNHSFSPIRKAPASFSSNPQRSLHKPATSTWV